MSYSPEAYGARCEACPLKHERNAGRAVAPEVPSDAKLLIVAEAPGKTEVALGRPLIGASGKELERALLAAGRERGSVGLTNVLLCRPPGAGSLMDYLIGLRVQNGRRAAQGRPLLASPLECCRTRLMGEVWQARALLLLGVTARMSLEGRLAPGGQEGFMRRRGFPSWVTLQSEGQQRKLRVLSTVHPAFVLRARRWTSIFRSDVAKAIRMAEGRLTWRATEKVFFPRPDELANVLARLTHAPALDVETTLAGPTRCRLHCIGIGDYDLATCIPIASVLGAKFPAGMRVWYTPAEQQRILEILRAWLGDAAGSMAIHNSVFDLAVLEHEAARGTLPGLEVRRRVFDTILAHHDVWSELPHDLGFCSSQYTDAEEHKDVDHRNWQSDRDQQAYCMDDVAVTSYLAEQLATDARLVPRVYQADRTLSYFCRRLHAIGLKLDLVERDRHHARLTERMAKTQAAVQRLAVAGLPRGATKEQRQLAEGFNPGSPDQMRVYLFSVCGVAPVPQNAGGQTATGEPSVSRDNLFYLIDKGLPAVLEDFIQETIDYREASKLRGTYCETEPDQDGRVRPTWNPHVVVSGRLSTNEPNVLNVKGPLRSMYVAEEGHRLLFLDKAQLELRIIAWLAKDTELIEAFLAGLDVHRVNTAAILGLAGPEAVTDKQRKFGKTFTYAIQYGAGVRKAWQMVRNFRDKDGSRPYKDLAYKAANAAYDRWWDRRKAVKKYFEDGVKLWRTQGYLEEPLHGRRRYFLDGEEEEKEAMSNFRIQSGAAADVNDAQERVFKAYPWGFAGPNTGIVHQNYDSLGLEVPIGTEAEIGRHIKQLMHSMLGDMPLPVDVQAGNNWFELEKIE